MYDYDSDVAYEAIGTKVRSWTSGDKRYTETSYFDVGRSLLDCHNSKSRDRIQQVVDWFAADESHNIVYTFHNEKQNKDVYMVALRDEGKLIGYYEKHEYRNSETMKPYDLW